MELPQRRSGIPIPKSKFSLKKNISKSTDDLLSGTSFETSGELDTFTLLEENISLKEKIESVSSDKNSREYYNAISSISIISYQKILHKTK